jgi:hypothetical protein
MMETAAHLADHVFPRLPVRQWVSSVPKRLRNFLQLEGATLGMAQRKWTRQPCTSARWLSSTALASA